MKISMKESLGVLTGPLMVRFASSWYLVKAFLFFPNTCIYLRKEVSMIGIITALPKEYAAIEVLLDRPRSYLVPGAGVGRQYTLGEIPAANGETHQVVLVLLSSMGTGLAAAQASRLLEHFPQIHIILMVGIAAGVPSPQVPDEHVRLGDIVVSDQYGVIQYDFVKRTTEQTLYRPFPRSPSADLLLAAKLLEAGQMKGQRPWQPFIAQAQRRLRITRPTKETDVLVSSDDPAQFITHPRDRKRSAGQPRVFIGPIASANTLLKDARLRDELRDRLRVKAVEMEGAGVADATWDMSAGYLVIRGICDYGDVHKTDTWQEYAAVVAAGYTRALLQSLPTSPARPDAPVRPARDAGTMLPLEYGQSPVVAPFPPIWNVPYRSHPLFADNKDLLQVIHERFTRTAVQTVIQPQGLSGPGGIGKTRFATEYAFHHRSDYDAILWVNAASHDMLLTEFAVLAGELNLPEKDAQEQRVVRAAVTHWLTRHTRWLLVMDNADDLKMAEEFIPATGRGHILLTTRSHPLYRLADRTEISTMTPEEGALFLLRRATILEREEQLEDALPEDVRDALALTHEMGGLPLALDQIGAYIEETGCGVSGYVDVYRTHAKELLNERGEIVTDHADPVATTWVLAFRRIDTHSPAAELLRLCAFLSPDAIPEEIVLEGTMAAKRARGEAPLITDAYALNEAARELIKSSLIQRDDKARTIIIHRLVQTALKNWISQDSHASWVELAVRAVAHVFPEQNEVSWERCQRYLTQVFVCQELVREYQISCNEAAGLFERAGNYLQLRAQYEQAESLYQQAIAIYERNSITGTSDLATTLERYAVLLRNTGRETEAIACEQRVQEIQD
jgi:nucleoside phosphorylase/tetratricopeptide (TPR) repeat protein